MTSNSKIDQNSDIEKETTFLTAIDFGETATTWFKPEKLRNGDSKWRNWWFWAEIGHFGLKLISFGRNWSLLAEIGDFGCKMDHFWPKLFILWQNLSFWWVINISLVAHEIFYPQIFAKICIGWQQMNWSLNRLILNVSCYPMQMATFFNCLIVIKPNDILFSMLSLLLKCFNFLMQMWHSKIIKFWKW